MGKKRVNGEGTFSFIEKKGYWHYKLTLGYGEDGRPIRKSFYGKSRAEAKAKGEKALEKLQGQSVSVSPDMTLEKWIPLYLESYKKGTVKETWYSMLLDLAKKIPPNLGKKKVSDITPIELQRFINTLSAQYSKSYTQKAKNLVKSALEEAMENGLCVKNPARKLTVPDKPEKPRESFTAEETALIIQYAPEHHNKVIATATIALLLTGMRRGEMLGLKWSDIDGDVLHIRRGVYIENNLPKAEEFVAKTEKSIRDIPLLPELKNLMEALPRTGEYIFASKSGGLIEPHNFNRRYYNFLDFIISKVEGFPRLSPHCCRHTYATLALSAGGNLRNVQLLLGHTDPKTTARYTHPDNDALRETAKGVYKICTPTSTPV